MTIFRLFTLSTIMMVLGIIAAGCKKTPSPEPFEAKLLLNRLSISVVPGGTENITVTSTDENNLPQTFTVESDTEGIATITKTDSIITVTGLNYGTANVTVRSDTSDTNLLKTFPVQVYNNMILETDELIIAFVDSFQYRWCDRGSGQPDDGEYYHPLTKDSFKALGSIGLSGYYNPNGLEWIMVVKAKPGSNALVPPDSYELVWADHGSGANDDGSFWLPIPPTGYVALGIVAQAGYNEPGLDDVVCVREDLTVPGTAGSYIWKYVPFPPFVSFASWRIDPPDAGPHDDAYLSTGTFVAWTSGDPPSAHPVMNVLKVPLPLLAEAPYQTYVPKLTGYDTPSEQTVPMMAKEMLIPCTLLNDSLFAGNPMWRIHNSPFYRLERQVYYKLLYHNHNQTSQVQTNNVTIKSGVTTTESNRYWNETGIEITVEGGVSIEFFSGKVSTTISTKFGYETQTSVAELQEKEVTSAVNTSPGKAAALWQKYNRYVLKRHNGTRLEPVAAWEFGIDSYVTDEYPDD
jgi:Vacuolar protein sorting-associated protein 62/Insecticidal Crystal Toxin, P42